MKARIVGYRTPLEVIYCVDHARKVQAAVIPIYSDEFTDWSQTCVICDETIIEPVSEGDEREAVLVDGDQAYSRRPLFTPVLTVT